MRLAVFASGGGTNFQAIVDNVESGDLPAEVVCCVSNTPDAGALERARAHEIPTEVIVPAQYEAPQPFGEDLLDLLNAYDVSFVALAGYMVRIPPNVVAAYHERMTNIHPALLPAFGGKGMYGMHVHRAVLEYGVHWSGATVHLVDEEYDHGPIVLQEPVPVYADDTPEELASRIQKVEHKLYPEALRLFAQDRVRRDGRSIWIEDVGRHSPRQSSESKSTSP